MRYPENDRLAYPRIPVGRSAHYRPGALERLGGLFGLAKINQARTKCAVGRLQCGTRKDESFAVLGLLSRIGTGSQRKIRRRACNVEDEATDRSTNNYTTPVRMSAP
jgi:hypothetical protein